MVLKAAAKINLMLDILGQTEDGYHTLFMIMQSVGVYDTVTLTETGKPGTITLSCSNGLLPSDETNIGFHDDGSVPAVPAPASAVPGLGCMHSSPPKPDTLYRAIKNDMFADHL